MYLESKDQIPSKVVQLIRLAGNPAQLLAMQDSDDDHDHFPRPRVRMVRMMMNIRKEEIKGRRAKEASSKMRC